MLPAMSYSWETSSAASAPASVAPVGHTRRRRGSPAGAAWGRRDRVQVLARRSPRPELLLLMGIAAALNLWALSRNGWANEYYSAAVRSMSSSWHDFLYASLDKSGVMTVDKPPLALWVQALSVRLFGYHQLSVLVPQALMGVASVVLLYDLVRRHFGRIGGFVAGLALAVTPMTVAISRHNNPDALLVLCSVAAVWCALRGLENGRTRWLALAGVCVGLGFETKMGVALVVVPGIVAAWLWLAPAARGRLHALRQLLAGGAAMVLVGGAWPALVELTPAADRPWVSGTSDNKVLSLIFGYNGLGRVDGQAGGPRGAGGGAMFGSSPGPLRLLNGALGGQAGWLLGFAVVAALGLLVASRLRRSDARTGWLLTIGGAFLATAVLFSAANGIFHPYYVSLLAPFTAALVGAGAAQLIGGRLNARVFGPLAIVAGVAVELAIRDDYSGQLPWLPAVLSVVGALAIIALLAFSSRRARLIATAAAVGALLLAPSVWAIDTLGHAASGTFPAGGPASAASDGVGAGGPFGRLGARLGAGGGFPGGPTAGSAAPAGAPPFARGEGAAAQAPPGVGGFAGGSPPGLPGSGRSGGTATMFGAPGGGAGGPFGNDRSLAAVVAYVRAHGGGTVAVSSQSSAAAAIIQGKVEVAGIGGFSGRESDVSVAWLAQEVSSDKIRWVLADQNGTGFAGRLPGDTRAGSKAAMSAVAKGCKAVTLSTSGSATAAGSSASGATGATSSTLYDCQGRSQALLSAGTSS
jgi:4-amino-4-deoxy-L-arabinose transferase-like glycosyltransferase